MQNTTVLRENISLKYGTIDGTIEEDEIFPGIEREISDQEQEAKRNILINLICITTALTVLVLIVSTVSTNPTF